MPCQKYNLDHVDGYVIHDKYQHPSKIRNLTDFNPNVYNGKEALLTFFKQNDQELFQTVENKMESIIKDVVRSHYWSFETKTKQFGKQHKQKNLKFFELVRFDFIIDSTKKIWLMEVNMSPNLDSSHFKENAVLYRRVVDWALQKGVWERCEN